MSRTSPSERSASRERVAATLFGFYKSAVSPLLHGIGVTQCKFLPTCSEYAYTAVAKHGWLRGGWLAAGRIARCRPFARGGFDPVP